MFFKSIESSGVEKVDFSQYTLILPAISVGNIGQLTVDVLITTTQAENIGTIYDESLIPVIGNDPYISTDSAKLCKLSSCCNVYMTKVEKLVIIQQRATFVKGKRKQFRSKLIQWIKETQFRQVFLIGSTFAHMRTDQQISGSQFRYVATEKAKSSMTVDSSHLELEDTPDEFGRLGKHLPGSGIAKTFYEDCCREEIPLVELLMFCSEGDNTPDALKMAEYANKWLNIISNLEIRQTVAEMEKVWKIPQSWRLNFGNSYNKLIY